MKGRQPIVAGALQQGIGALFGNRSRRLAGVLFDRLARRFMPSLHLQGDGFGVTGGVGEGFARMFFLRVDGDPLDQIGIAQR